MRAGVWVLVGLMGCGPRESPLLAELPPCEVTTGDALVDLGQGCVAQACLGQKISRWTDELSACDRIDEQAQVGTCDWYEHGLKGRYDTRDRRMTSFELHPDSVLITDEGLGIGASVACFVLVHGEPQEMDMVEVYGRYRVVDARWTHLGLHITDEEEPFSGGRYDGYVDTLRVDRR